MTTPDTVTVQCYQSIQKANREMVRGKTTTTAKKLNCHDCSFQLITERQETLHLSLDALQFVII